MQSFKQFYLRKLKKINRIASSPTFVLGFLLCALLIVILFTYNKYGITWDELDQIALGKYGLTYYLSLGVNHAYFSFIPIHQFYLTRGPLIEIVRELLIRGHGTVALYHLVLALFALSAFYFLFKIIYFLSKNTSLSAASLLLLVFMPRFYGDMFVNSKDSPLVYLLLAACYFSLLYFSGNRQRKTLILLGVSYALGTSVRIILIYAYLLFVFVSMLQILLSEKKQIKIAIRDQTIIFLVYLFVLHMTQPFLLTKPILGIFDMITASENYPWFGNLLFQGRVYQSTNLPWYYLPVWIGISTPLITLLFFVFGNMFLVSRLFQKQKTSESYIYLFIVLLFWLPIGLVVFVHPLMYDAWRQFLFLSGPLILIASLGVYSLYFFRFKPLIYIGYFLILINILLTGYTMIRLHPYEYIYFNSIVGGLKGAYQKYETDYWGASFKEATEWIEKNRNNLVSAHTHNTLSISPCVPHLVIPYLKQGTVLGTKPPTVYYCYTRDNEDKEYNGQIVHIIEREGVPLNIIKMRK